jgi:hypothetical protein
MDCCGMSYIRGGSDRIYAFIVKIVKVAKTVEAVEVV